MVDFFFDFTGIFGDSPAGPIEKAKIFRKELELIDQKNIDFFKNKRSMIPGEEHDSIFNHCKTYIGYDPVKFFFTDDVVPAAIQKECFDAFERVFEYRAYPRKR